MIYYINLFLLITIIIIIIIIIEQQRHSWMSAVSFKEIQGLSCSSSRIYNSVCLDLNPSWGREATTITFLSLRPLHFLSFYLQPKPRRSQMWRNVTLYDRWVCVRVCVCVYIICLLLPICPRFCHIFLLYEHQQKNWSPHTAWLHPTSVTGKGHFLHKLSTVKIWQIGS